jgi:hypothetical protein
VEGLGREHLVLRRYHFVSYNLQVWKRCGREVLRADPNLKVENLKIRELALAAAARAEIRERTMCVRVRDAAHGYPMSSDAHFISQPVSHCVLVDQWPVHFVGVRE